MNRAMLTVSGRLRYRLITAPAHITVLGKPYYYYWDDQPYSDHGLGSRLGQYGSLVQKGNRMADGDTPEAALKRLRALGFNPNERYQP